MKIERTKNAGRNIAFGIILKIYQIVVPFLMRTAMIYIMGVEYLGLNSLFASILQVLNLAELGVGSAMVYSMYRPIAEDDKKTICALLQLYRTYYRIIGLVIAVAGICITPFVPKLIKSDLPGGLNVYILYLMNLAITVLSYWLFAYKNSLLQAYQRVDVVSKVTLATTTLQYILQLLALILFKNYYMYTVANIATQALNNISVAAVTTKMFPDYKPIGKLKRSTIQDINHRIRDLFTSKVGAVIYDSADTLVISAFLGLSILAIYQNYYYILNSITGFIAVIFNACTAGIGNSIVVETKEKNYADLRKFTFIICWLGGFCSVCLLCLYQPFMEIWVGKNLMLEFPAVICFVVYFYVRQLNTLLNTYKDASGMWHEDRFRPLTAAMTNLILNLIMVRFIGIYGIILSTVIAILFVGMPWLLHNLFTVIFDKKYLVGYVKQLVVYTLVVVVSCIVTKIICDVIPLARWAALLVRAIVCLIIPNIIYFVVYKNTIEFKQTLELANKMTRQKFEKVFIKLGM